MGTPTVEVTVVKKKETFQDKGVDYSGGCRWRDKGNDNWERTPDLEAGRSLITWQRILASSEDGSHIVKGWVNGGKFKVMKMMTNTMVVWARSSKSKPLGESLGILMEREEWGFWKEGRFGWAKSQRRGKRMGLVIALSFQRTGKNEKNR